MERPEFTDPYEAARVSTFMEAGSHGRWRLLPFTVTPAQAQGSLAVAHLEGGKWGEMRAKRTVPAGNYVILQRRMTPDEFADIRSGAIADGVAVGPGANDYVPIMTDTPSEISEHSEVIEKAHGRVLITGLGLGCVVSALLAKPGVSHITVVEIDRDVIALTGPYYENEPRVTIVNYDALAYGRDVTADRAYGRTAQFDYAWHDIWSHIADRNLDDDSIAEHGISYKTLFDAYAPFCTEQGAWAHDLALEMVEANRESNDRMAIWIGTVLNSSPEGRVPLIEDYLIRQGTFGFPENEPIPDELREFCRENFGSLDHATKLSTDAGFLAAMEEARDKVFAHDPMARPNEVEEANVAR